MAILPQIDDKILTARTLNFLGDIERIEGNTTAARLHFEESLAICRQFNLKGDLIYSFANMGAINFEEGNFATSNSFFAEALAMAQEFKDKKMISIALDGFAALAVKRGELALAARLAGVEQSLCEKIGYEKEPADRRFRDAYLAELKSKMDESDFSEFYEQGRKLKLEEVIALVTSLEY